MSEKRKRSLPNRSPSDHSRAGRFGPPGNQSLAGPSNPQQIAPQPLQAPLPSAPPTVTPQSQTFAMGGSPALQSQSPSIPGGSKVAIPRMIPSIGQKPSSSRKSDKHRISHACEPCRQRKTKCSGERPVCKHCQDYAIPCVYADGKRDRVRKAMTSMESRLADYEELLIRVSSQVDGTSRMAIEKALQRKDSADDTPKTDSKSPTRSPTKDKEKEREQEQEQESDYDAGEETDISGDAGSTGSLDRALEDVNLNPETRAIGFMGRNSEVTWMQSLRRMAEFDVEGDPGRSRNASNSQRHERMRQEKGAIATEKSQGSTRFGGSSRPFHQSPNDIKISDSGYHLDDTAISISQPVNPYDLPDRQLADVYIHRYFDTAHASLPIVFKPHFLKEYNDFMDHELRRDVNITPHQGSTRDRLGQTPAYRNRRWLAVLNAILAIGAKHVQLTSPGHPRDEVGDDKLFFTKARMLSLNNDAIAEHSDLDQVRCASLMTLYLISIGQINRAWNLCGLAVRNAVSLGLNLRIDVGSVSGIDKEIRVRLWWSVYTLERQLGFMTGRPSSISDQDCTLSLPIPVEEEDLTDEIYELYDEDEKQAYVNNRRSPGPNSGTDSGTSEAVRTEQPGILSEEKIWNTSLRGPPNGAAYFVNYVQLSMITHQIIRELYRAETIYKSWAGVQKAIQSFDRKLKTWKSLLPDAFDFEQGPADTGPLANYRIDLAFLYYGARILLYRPCVCRTERRMPRESHRSAEFNREAAGECITAAINIIGLLDDQPNMRELYKTSLWWCILRQLMQAAIVLLLELSYRAEHTPAKAEDILNDARKAVIWLRVMSQGDLSAERAFAICDQMFQLVAPRVGGEASSASKHLDPQAEGSMLPPYQAGIKNPNPQPSAEYEQTHSLPQRTTSFTSSSQQPHVPQFSMSGQEPAVHPMDIDWLGPYHFARHIPTSYYYGGPLDPLSTDQSHPIYAPFDQFLPYQPVTQPSAPHTPYYTSSGQGYPEVEVTTTTGSGQMPFTTMDRSRYPTADSSSYDMTSAFFPSSEMMEDLAEEDAERRH